MDSINPFRRVFCAADCAQASVRPMVEIQRISRQHKKFISLAKQVSFLGALDPEQLVLFENDSQMVSTLDIPRNGKKESGYVCNTRTLCHGWPFQC